MNESPAKNRADCLSEAMLRSAAMGEGTPEELSLVESHLSDCEACQARFDEIFSADTDLQSVRSAFERTQGSVAAGSRSLKETCLPAWSTMGDRIAICDGVQLPPPRDPRFRARLGSYEVASLLGRGGMGIVLKGYDPVLQRYAALKVLKPELAADPVAQERFMREARSTARLQHPNIATIFSVEPQAEPAFIAMEFVRGRSLASQLSLDGQLPPSLAMAVALGVLAGLGYAHRAGIIHRDVKPSNILLNLLDGPPKLVDFGLARGIADVSRQTLEGVVVGTAWYMAPEQATCERAIDGRCDLFSMGVVLFEMLAGTLPFPGSDPHQVVSDICQKPAPDLRELCPAASGKLAEVVATALRKVPSERFQTAEEFAQGILGCSEYSATSQAETRTWAGMAVPLPSMDRSGTEAGADSSSLPGRDRITCQYSTCALSIILEEAFVCERCNKRICQRHKDRELLAFCGRCAEDVRGEQFESRSRSWKPDEATTAILRSLAAASQGRPPFRASIWTERSGSLPARDIATVTRHNKQCYRIGDVFTLNAQSDRDCFLTLIDVGTSGAVSLLVQNHALRAGKPVSLLGPDEEQLWRLTGPPGVERVKAFFTLQPLSLFPASNLSGSFTPQPSTRDIVAAIRRAGESLDQMAEDGWTDALCEFVVEP